MPFSTVCGAGQLTSSFHKGILLISECQSLQHQCFCRLVCSRFFLCSCHAWVSTRCTTVLDFCFLYKLSITQHYVKVEICIKKECYIQQSDVAPFERRSVIYAYMMFARTYLRAITSYLGMHGFHLSNMKYQSTNEKKQLVP